jgi:hypothetical protein
MYPVDPAARIDAFSKNKKALETIVKAASAKGTKGVSNDFVKTFFERKGTADDPDDGQ